MFPSDGLDDGELLLAALLRRDHEVGLLAVSWARTRSAIPMPDTLAETGKRHSPTCILISD
jgi:hypothetical protein